MQNGRTRTKRPKAKIKTRTILRKGYLPSCLVHKVTLDPISANILKKAQKKGSNKKMFIQGNTRNTNVKTITIDRTKIGTMPRH